MSILSIDYTQLIASLKEYDGSQTLVVSNKGIERGTFRTFCEWVLESVKLKNKEENKQQISSSLFWIYSDLQMQSSSEKMKDQALDSVRKAIKVINPGINPDQLSIDEIFDRIHVDPPKDSMINSKAIHFREVESLDDRKTKVIDKIFTRFINGEIDAELVVRKLRDPLRLKFEKGQFTKINQVLKHLNEGDQQLLLDRLAVSYEPGEPFWENIDSKCVYAASKCPAKEEIPADPSLDFGKYLVACKNERRFEEALEKITAPPLKITYSKEWLSAQKLLLEHYLRANDQVYEKTLLYLDSYDLDHCPPNVKEQLAYYQKHASARVMYQSMALAGTGAKKACSLIFKIGKKILGEGFLYFRTRTYSVYSLFEFYNIYKLSSETMTAGTTFIKGFTEAYELSAFVNTNGSLDEILNSTYDMVSEECIKHLDAYTTVCSQLEAHPNEVSGLVAAVAYPSSLMTSTVVGASAVSLAAIASLKAYMSLPFDRESYLKAVAKRARQA